MGAADTPIWDSRGSDTPRLGVSPSVRDFRAWSRNRTGSRSPFAVALMTRVASSTLISDDRRCLGSVLSAWRRPPSHRRAGRAFAVHSITSSARSKNDPGIVKPSAFAVSRFITRLNLVGCSTGKSPALEPREILFTSRALS
jgi:hypothetical protein